MKLSGGGPMSVRFGTDALSRHPLQRVVRLRGHLAKSMPKATAPNTAKIGPHQIIGTKNNVCDLPNTTSSPVLGSIKTFAPRLRKTRPRTQHTTAETNSETAKGHLWSSQYAPLPVTPFEMRLATREQPKVTTATRKPLPVQTMWIIA